MTIYLIFHLFLISSLHLFLISDSPYTRSILYFLKKIRLEIDFLSGVNNIVGKGMTFS
jgi:hypothetical protein